MKQHFLQIGKAYFQPYLGDSGCDLTCNLTLKAGGDDYFYLTLEAGGDASSELEWSKGLTAFASGRVS